MRLSTKLFFSFFMILMAAGTLPCLECRARAEAQQSFISTTPEKMEQLVNLHKKAEILIEQNKFREAVDVYSEIILVEPDDEAAYTNLGHAYMILGDFERAEDAFKNALHINPDNETALLGLQKISDPDSTLYSDQAP